MQGPIKTFNLAGPLPRGRLLIEASAGTGKTYSLTALIARYVAEGGVRADQLLVVTFTRAAAAELREQTRARLSEALASLDSGDEPKGWLKCVSSGTDGDREQRRTRLQDALAAIDSATITTIHGFFQSALAELGVRAGVLGSGVLVEDHSRIVDDAVHDVLVARLADDPDALIPTGQRTPSQLATSLGEVISRLASNLGSAPAPAPHSPGNLVSTQSASDSDVRTDDQIALGLSELAGALLGEIRAGRIAAGDLGYDDLITGLVGLLDDPMLRDAVAAALRQRYRVVLIDEFQDTDAVQWRLFDEVFCRQKDDGELRALVAVGDPKQAIYRFRGADIATYLRVRTELPVERMGVNWRSDASVLSVLNGWLAGRTFGDDAICYEKVDPRPDALGSALSGGGKPVQLRWLPNDGGLATGSARRRVGADVAAHIVNLLSEGRIDEGHGDGRSREVRPADICILVRDHSEGDVVVDALQDVGVPVVRSRVGSVLMTEAVSQWRMLLRALVDPSDGRAVRAAMLGWFLGRSAVDLDDDRVVEEAQQSCAAWAARLAEVGMMSFYQSLRTDPAVVAALAATPDADRRLTDVEHVAELVDAAVSGRQVTARSVLTTLETLAGEAGEAEAQARRVDSDAQAVQVTTIHSSKGLEYPIVLVPFPKGTKNDQPYVYVTDGMRWVDAAPHVGWSQGDGHDDRKALASVEIDGDAMRLLYVALTRARHQLVVWWYCAQDESRSALAHLLFDRHFAQRPDKKTRWTQFVADGAATATVLNELSSRLGSEFAFSELATAAPDTPRYVPPSPFDAAGLTVATPPPAPLARRTWNRWSYSAVVKGVRDQEAPWSHGSDQPAEGDDAGMSGPDAMGTPLIGGLVNQPAGKAFGNFVHATFEHLDPAAPDLKTAIDGAMAQSPAWQRLGVDAASCVDGIADVVLTPLDPLPSGVRLRDIPRSDLLPEMPFHLGLADASATVAVADLARLVVDDPVFGDYFTRLAADTDGFNISGLLTGSIDVVLRVPGDGAPLHCVADYKTNRLHPRDLPAMTEHYGVGSMRVGMEHGDYPTQALIYLVALHRFLAARLDGYDPDRHLGPALYLFVRGMTGPDTPVLDGVRNGVFAWRPSTATILAASRLLSGGSVSSVGGPNGRVG